MHVITNTSCTSTLPAVKVTFDGLRVLLMRSCCNFGQFVVIIDEDEPVVNQSIVHEVVEASQRSFSQELCKCMFLKKYFVTI